MSLAPGTKLGPAEILAPLGAGGMVRSTARETRDSAARWRSAKLPEHLERESDDALALLEREAKIVSSLNHPNICTLFDGAGKARPTHP